MPQWLWKDGRLSWGVVGFIAFSTVWMIVLDLVWRTVKLQFDILLICGLLIGGAAAVALIVGARLARSVWLRPRA